MTFYSASWFTTTLDILVASIGDSFARCGQGHMFLSFFPVCFRRLRKTGWSSCYTAGGPPVTSGICQQEYLRIALRTIGFRIIQSPVLHEFIKMPKAKIFVELLAHNPLIAQSIASK